MTVFGWDASDFDWPRGPMDLAAAHAAGVDWFTHKATEGTSVKHLHYRDALARARAAGIPVLGAYHVVRSGPTIAAQVRFFLDQLDAATPWWRDHQHFVLQVDLELWAADHVMATLGVQLGEQLAADTGHRVLLYASNGQYADRIPGSLPLWNADYPSSWADNLHTLYADAGADAGRGWRPYSGRTPVMWQYTSAATIGSQPRCDANAFRGSLAELLAFTGGNTDVSTHTDAVIDAWRVGNKVASDGSAVAPVEWRIRDEAWQTAISADTAALKTLVASQGVTITALADLLRAAGSPDVAPLVAQIQALTAQVTNLAASEAALQQRLAAALAPA